MLALAPNLLQESGPDLFGIGLVLSIVGCFLLANSILFRHPRTLVADFFQRAERRLASIREYIFHRVQVHLGFLYLLGGFGFQLFGHFRPQPAAGDLPREFPVLWIGVIALTVVVLELLGWWLSYMLFRKYVREHFRLHPPSLESNMHLARELGELFGIASQGDDSVQSYLLRIRRKIGLPAQPVEPRRPRELPVEPGTPRRKKMPIRRFMVFSATGSTPWRANFQSRL